MDVKSLIPWGRSRATPAPSVLCGAIVMLAILGAFIGVLATPVYLAAS